MAARSEGASAGVGCGAMPGEGPPAVEVGDEASEIESSTAVGGAAGDGVAWASVVVVLTSAVAAEASAVAVV